MKKLFHFLNFLLLFWMVKKTGAEDGEQFIFHWEELSISFLFLVFWLLTRKTRWSVVQNSSTSFPLIWNNLVNYFVLVYNSTYTYACWILCAFFQFVLRNTGKMSCEWVFKSYETCKWNFVTILSWRSN